MQRCATDELPSLKLSGTLATSRHRNQSPLRTWSKASATSTIGRSEGSSKTEKIQTHFRRQGQRNWLFSDMFTEIFVILNMLRYFWTLRSSGLFIIWIISIFQLFCIYQKASHCLLQEKDKAVRRWEWLAADCSSSRNQLHDKVQ